VSGDLPLAASSVPGECFLPERLWGFQREFPRVHVRATIADTRLALLEVEKGHAEVALVGGKAENPRLQFRALGADGLVLVVPRGHRWDGRNTSISALRGEPLILRESGSGSRCAVLKTMERSGVALTALSVVLELGSNGAIKDAVRRGLGVAFLSHLAVQKELDEGDLAIVKVDGLDVTRDFYLAVDSRRPLRPAARAFLRYLDANPIRFDKR
jgi:LysR family transcriptional regulator, low CO2-responsive transcriptional regulator